MLFEEDDATRALIEKNPRTRFTMHVKDDGASPAPLPATIASASKEVFERPSSQRRMRHRPCSWFIPSLCGRGRRTTLVGYLAGSDPTSGTILLSAHLDHLGVVSQGINGDAIFNGANGRRIRNDCGP